MEKILIIHPRLTDYRKNIFISLNEKYDCFFLFANKPTNKKLERLIKRDFKFSLFKNLRYTIFPYGLVPSLIKKNYDIILTSIPFSVTSLLALVIAKMKNKKVIFWGEEWRYPNSRILKIFSPILKYFIRRCDSLVVPSSKAKMFYQKLGVKKKKIFIAPSSAEIILPLSQKLLKKKYNLENKKVILFLSRIVEVKGLKYLIKSFSKIEKSVPDAYLLVAGEGDMRNNCEELAKSLKIKNIKFTGYANRGKTRELMNLCDIFVLPSTIISKDVQNHEAWGMVLNEVMSLGKPAITTTAVGAANELVKNGKNGFVVKDKDTGRLSKQMLSLLNDDEGREKMGRQARQTIMKEFSNNKMLEGFIKSIQFSNKSGN